ncbi:MAG: uroporphyrinogen decarboxylase family protein, partial [Exiguobacterium sp.]
GASHQIEEWHDLPLDVVGLDWRLSVQEARDRGITKAVQGNLDPSFLLAPWPVIEEKVKEILDEGMKQPGYVFNLGHGVFPEVDPAVLVKLTAFIHDYSREKMGGNES